MEDANDTIVLSSKEFCGDTIPDPFTTKGNVLNLKFTSDNIVTAMGFSLDFLINLPVGYYTGKYQSLCDVLISNRTNISIHGQFYYSKSVKSWEYPDGMSIILVIILVFMPTHWASDT